MNEPTAKNAYHGVWDCINNKALESINPASTYTKLDLKTCEELNVPSLCPEHENPTCKTQLTAFQKCLTESPACLLNKKHLDSINIT